MIEYPKIETLYNRNPENMKNVILGELRTAEFALVDKWLVTEKIDGTNVRAIYDPSDRSFGVRGKTDNASLHPKLVQAVMNAFPLETIDEIFPDADSPITFYGEGYGPKVQSGGWYRSDMGFRIFDVRIGDWWLNWDNVCDVAAKVGLSTVPVIADNRTLAEAVSLVRENSSVSALEGGEVGRKQEGIVCRTDPLLLMRNGERLMWKLKVKDIPR